MANYLADLFARYDIETQQMVASESLVQLVKKNDYINQTNMYLLKIT